MVCLSSKDEFQCRSNECIKWTYVCDGIPHCSNKADEDCDMCTNDLYICKDSSRINCTLACSTLGYIPCKNYADRKICSSYAKKSNYLKLNSILKQIEEDNNSDNLKESSPFFGNARFSGSLLKNLPSNEKIIFSALGAVVLVFLILFLVLFGVMYKRFKQKKRMFTTRLASRSQSPNSTAQNDTGVNTKPNPLSNLNIITKNNSRDGLNNPEHAYISDYNNLIEGGTKYKALSKSHNESKLSKNDEICRSSIFASIDNLSNEIKNQEQNDYQIYGEPPPSYKQFQLYPKANLDDNKNSQVECSVEPLLKISDSNDDESHVYENIDDLNDSNNDKELKKNSKLNSVNTSRGTPGNKRAKFKTLKKYSLNDSMKIKKTTINSELNHHSDFSNSLDISVSPSSLSTSSSSTLSKSNQKLKKKEFKNLDDEIFL
ncbi:Low-density lipo receptor-related [Brachionus plicatilis]|uniref:Low-density lipo receptor-related n=1 Tax=Brachionus plicatilis TaxID=10195 RepID=A0A3M7SZ86_BRAPC|nr:Low-density lipo receptor-related [Brachionus plicatilis]